MKSLKTNFWLDAFIFAGFLAALQPRLTGIAIHEWFTLAATANSGFTCCPALGLGCGYHQKVFQQPVSRLALELSGGRPAFRGLHGCHHERVGDFQSC